ncbi:50S ribosomal protein L11 methyltransferase [Sediminibacterium goheungense]|uniref:Ribosomal protein L11 methyltransferase n=1 Tax=Sediminibacterium goheungense TaxID=1086393 RepID=A0A4V3C514_9BACT|nr:50S ribosomal protein L11 methyltransferase [Sediminibacterium goheungense]TDO28018.1 ribosomal protein L11 methyltransferase [Sediminibacterium goheungense]
MNHYQILIPVTEESIRELLIAQLAEAGFDGFEESETALKAYAEEEKFNENELKQIIEQMNLSYSKSIIKKENWNAVWESNFEPVLVDDFVGIRAGFHAPLTGIQHEIVITPKMSFGTGHHATTFSVMQLMREIDFQDKTVFDFGTGTGILAILAEKLGATAILAVDYDDWCVENASENTLINKCQCIDIQKNDTAFVDKPYEIVIANINKNIILDNLPLLAKSVIPGGEIILSGLLLEDENDIITACKPLGWQHIKTIQKGAWIAMRLRG